MDYRVRGTRRRAAAPDGLRAALQIRARWPAIGILVLSQYVEETYATDLLAADTSGLGYLLKDHIADVGEFVGAVRRAGDGGTALDPEVVAQLLARSRRRDPLDRLSPREREVLGLMAEGRANGAVEATSDNGSVLLELVNSPRSVHVESNNGDVEVALPQSELLHNAVAETDNGSVTMSVHFDPDSDRSITAMSDSGDVSVHYTLD